VSTQVFVDTSAFLALADTADPGHSRAVELLGHLEGPLVTSNLVLLETTGLVSDRAGHRKAAEVLDRLRAVAGLKVFHIDPEVERKGWEFFLRESRRGIAPVRAMNFALMRELGIRMVFTFDRVARDLGFLVVPMTEG
jgi:predicted nucleic acid-binding protein